MLKHLWEILLKPYNNNNYKIGLAVYLSLQPYGISNTKFGKM